MFFVVFFAAFCSKFVLVSLCFVFGTLMLIPIALCVFGIDFIYKLVLCFFMYALTDASCFLTLCFQL